MAKTATSPKILSVPLAELQRRTSAKWRRYPNDVLPMWVAEMDTQLAPPIVEAINQAVVQGNTGYPEGQATYASAFAGFARDRWGWQFNQKHTAIVPDVITGAMELLKLITKPGDPVIINPPVYQSFYALIASTNRRAVLAPLKPNGRLGLNQLEAAFAKAQKSKTGSAAYLLCSPQNPTGTVHSRSELAAVAQLADQYSVRVIADEIHAPIVYPDQKFVPYLSLPNTQTAFCLTSASKAWNLAGIRAALAIAGSGQAAEDLKHIPYLVSLGASHVGVIAHAAAFSKGVAWLDQLVKELDTNRQALSRLINEFIPNVVYKPPHATYMALLDCRATGLGPDPAATFLQKGKLALKPGHVFGPGNDGFARLNFATSPKLLREGVRRLQLALELYP